MGDWGDDINTTWDEEKPVEPEATKQVRQKRRSTECIERTTQNIYRRAYSETQLLDVTPRILKKGSSYHFITSGDVDALSFLKIILRQQNLDYCLFSTWCMASDDIMQIDEWITAGKIKKIDAYLGEIFPGTYKMEWKKINEVFDKHKCGRIAVFKNHSKIFAGYGNDFAFGIQTSANINTNPRTENACITIDDEIYKFYRSYFDDIISFKQSGTK